MKKLLQKIIPVILIFIMLFSLPVIISKPAKAADSSSELLAVETQIDGYLKDFLSVTSTTLHEEIADRRPGTEGEKKAALKIWNTLMSGTEFANLVPVESDSTKNGVQYFQFLSTLNNHYAVSQNIRFVKKSTKSGGKKVIIGTSYDNHSYFDAENKKYIDSASSAGGVATLLYLSKLINNFDENIMFDVEVVFFGAGSSNNAGAFAYTDVLTKADKENTLLFINLDQIMLGQNIYLYVNEVQTKQEKFLSKTFNNSGVQAAEYEKAVCIASSKYEGFDYTHRGMEGNNIAFLKHSITSLNVFCGYYENIGERLEYKGETTVANTKTDTYTQIKEIYGFGNMAKVAAGIKNILGADTLSYEMMKDKKANSWYLYMSNAKLPIAIMVVVILLFGLIYVWIYYSAKRNAEKVINSKGIDTILMQMQKELDDFDNMNLDSENDNKNKQNGDKDADSQNKTPDGDKKPQAEVGEEEKNKENKKDEK